MKYVFILVLVLVTVFPSFCQDCNPSEITTYYFIRHAEKDRSDVSNNDPHLLEKGKQRAEHWSAVFTNIKFDDVYSTDYNRTKETAMPTATRNNLDLTMYHPRNINTAEFLQDTKGKTVLIVGHSNTTPTFVNTILGIKKYEHMDDRNNANLYIVTISDNTISDVLLVID